jgi:hypothetical protein
VRTFSEPGSALGETSSARREAWRAIRPAFAAA